MKSAQNAARRFICRACGHVHAAWAPRCAECLSLDGLDVNANVKTLPMRFDWDPVVPARTAKIPPGAIRVTVPSLCRRAGIPVRATVDRPVYVYRGRKKIKTPAFDLVGVPVSPRSREGALRALEKLAYSFFDHCARYCVCERGYFTAAGPKTLKRKIHYDSRRSPRPRRGRQSKAS